VQGNISIGGEALDTLLDSWRWSLFFVWTRCCIMLCVCHTTPTQKLFCLHVFRQTGSPRTVCSLLSTKLKT